MTDLDTLVREAEEDPDTIGLFLHGSRGAGQERPGSDYDLIRVVTDEEYSSREAAGALQVKAADTDTVYTTLARLDHHAANPDWNTAGFLAARLLFDRTGEVEKRRRKIQELASERAAADLPERYDGYLNCFVRSIKAWRRGDALGGRLQAAASALYLVPTLFALERRWPPYLDRLEPELPALEEAQGWPSGYLRSAFLGLLTDGGVEHQIDLEDRVEALLRSRGVEHEWGTELDELKRM